MATKGYFSPLWTATSSQYTFQYHAQYIFSITAIIIEKGICNPNSNPGWSCLLFEKVLSTALDKQLDWLGLGNQSRRKERKFKPAVLCLKIDLVPHSAFGSVVWKIHTQDTPFGRGRRLYSSAEDTVGIFKAQLIRWSVCEISSNLKGKLYKIVGILVWCWVGFKISFSYSTS